MCGERHSASISDKKELYTWGCGANYRLGHGLLNDEPIPKLVQSIEEYYTVRASCGSNHTVSVTNDGHMYVWGAGQNGRLGISVVNESDQMLPTRIGELFEKIKKNQYIEVLAGPYQTFAVTKEGHLYAWGSIKFMTLGHPEARGDVFTPQRVFHQGMRGLTFWHHSGEEDAEEALEFDSHELECKN